MFDLRPNYGRVSEGNSELLQKVPCTATLSAPNSAAGHCQPMPPPETPGHSQASLGHSLVSSLLLFPGPVEHKVLFVPSKSPVLVLVALRWG